MRQALKEVDHMVNINRSESHFNHNEITDGPMMTLIERSAVFS